MGFWPTTVSTTRSANFPDKARLGRRTLNAVAIAADTPNADLSDDVSSEALAKGEASGVSDDGAKSDTPTRRTSAWLIPPALP
jgi:hypothetical protein